MVLKEYKVYVYVDGPETDYSKLVEKMEAWNIINFKLEISIYAYRTRRQGLNIMEFVDRKLVEVIIE